MRFIAVLVAAFIFTGGCSSHQPEKPDKLLAEDTYVNLLIEMQLLQAYQRRQQADSTAVDSLKRQIFEKYGATQQQFYESHAYYQQDMDRQSARIKKAIEELRKDHTLGTEQDSSIDTTVAK